MQPLGAAMGVLIGVVSGICLVLLLRTALAGRPGLRETLAITSELLAIPTFWFGGPWVTTALLQSLDLGQILPAYMVTLAFTFVLIALYPLVRLVIWLGNQIGGIESLVHA
ncbi:MAG: hypothetical protein ACR2IK_06880 [Chloroflexota bacterium]